MWDDGGLETLVEPVPVEDAFVTGLCRIEELGGGTIIRSWFYAEEAGVKVVKAKLVMPIQSAAIMTLQGSGVIMQIVQRRPGLMRLLGY